MTKHPSSPNYSTPLAGELKALFDAIPDESLIASFKTYYAGRRGYTYRVMWRTYVAMFYLSISTFADLIRRLQDNANLREAWLDECGLNCTNEDEEADLDSKDEHIERQFWSMCARVGQRLHDVGIMSARFGRPIPIIVHNLEYCDKVVAFTRDANPDGVVYDFVKWVDGLSNTA